MTYRILIVDDHAFIREMEALLIDQEHDFEVVAQAGNASEALERLSDDIDAAVVDLDLPGCHGTELIATIRERYPSVRCLAVTALLAPEAKGAALEAGAHAFAEKDGGQALIEGLRDILYRTVG